MNDVSDRSFFVTLLYDGHLIASSEFWLLLANLVALLVITQNLVKLSSSIQCIFRGLLHITEIGFSFRLWCRLEFILADVIFCQYAKIKYP